MDYNFCFNTISLPAENSVSAYNLLLDAFYGILELNDPGKDRFFLYYSDNDNNILAACELAQGYKYSDFLDELIKQDIDLASFIHEISDKSPALDLLLSDNETILNEIVRYDFYIPDKKTDKENDTLAITWHLDAMLLSLNTNTIWAEHEVRIAYCNPAKSYIEEHFFLHNISCKVHGKILYNNIFHKELSLSELFPKLIFTEEFLFWYSNADLRIENRIKIKDKLRIAYESNFQEGIICKTLKGRSGMREIKMRAYPGGAIRILFKTHSLNRHIILIGFIKKSDDEGYVENIKKANELFNTIK